MAKKKTRDLTGLSLEMQTFYRGISRRFDLSEHHRALLRCACEAHDRMDQARTLVATEGLTTIDRHGMVRPHPAVAIELASRTSFARLLRELGLADDVDSDANRPPRLSGRYRGRN
jgi:phage terminase small subunit